MNRKKIISVILTLLLLLACVTACQAASPDKRRIRKPLRQMHSETGIRQWFSL